MASDYEEWLRMHHAKFSTPSVVVDDVVARAMGARVVGRERVLRGEVNEVYIVWLSNGADCIVRIAHGEREHFVRAEAMIALARSVGVPAPESVCIEHVVLEDGERDVCVQHRMPGEPLAEILGELTEDEIHRIIADAGELLARLHSVTCEGGDEPLLQERTAEWLAGVTDLAAGLGGDAAELCRAFDVVNDVRATLDPRGSALVHSDFGTKHFMVHDGRISGILDWDGSRPAHPVVDIEWWDMYYDTPRHPIAVFLDGYTRIAALPDQHEVLRVALGLNHAMGLIGYYTSVENHSAARFSVDRVSHFLRKWEKVAG